MCTGLGSVGRGGLGACAWALMDTDWLSLESFALLCHLAGALLFVAGFILAGVLFELARRSERPQEIAALLRAARLGALLVALGGLMVPFFGLWLVHLEGFDYSARWIEMALGLYVAAMLLGGLGGQRPKQARILATELTERGEAVSSELRDLLDDRLSRVLNYISAALVLAILVLMVYKPT
ncbi:MAG TPA: DUF2269 family protein [Solirubrobacterales bacterium]|nr:DUF2269 family protein [Solirubrobacterales bacterium]